jgi:sterol desaturase/sphingolipid hydroxylase (fatty acid hydroxylase superfamily)
LSNIFYLVLSYFQTKLIYNYTNIDFQYLKIDNGFIKVYLSAILGYTTISSVGIICDLYSNYNHKFKIQPKCLNYKEYAQSLSLSLFNLIFITPIVTIPIWEYFNKKYEYFYIKSEDTQIILSNEILCFTGCILFVEIWFYVTHLLFHTDFLYKNIHKLHHKYKYPVASACVFAHPIEFAIGNLLGVILGPFFTNCHIYTFCMWVCFALLSTGGSHSGYYILGGEEHDIHHKYFKYNYGSIGLMDKIFGTNYYI